MCCNILREGGSDISICCKTWAMVVRTVGGRAEGQKIGGTVMDLTHFIDTFSIVFIGVNTWNVQNRNVGRHHVHQPVHRPRP